MPEKRSILLIFVLTFSAYSGFGSAYADPVFNSAEQFYGGYGVQVSTTPEFPQIGEPSQFLVRVTNEEHVEVDRSTIGIRVFHNSQQVGEITPTSVDSGHLDFDYVWRNTGNHIVKVDLYDMPGSDGILTYTFNMGTQSPFGTVFIGAIATGTLVCVGMMAYVFLPKILKKSKR